MNRPVIGITTDSSDSSERYLSTITYAAAVEKAGGLPLLLPFAVDHALIPQYVDLLDGICFSGGNDMNPARYGEEWHPKVARMDERREEFEFALIAEVEKRRLPALGVCFGSQLMNVYRGGSLIQFLPEQKPDSLEHRYLKEYGLTRHPIKLDANSLLGRAIGQSEVSVNTYHKQAVKTIGKGLRVIATAPDGVIEAFEDPSLLMFVAVQWHPERLIEEAEHLAPFKLLVSKSNENKSK
ncbi:MAG: gamma-glutamyl-gamma-aminobutyrate hydrolase family protein [Tepidisphaeraceae bacterium]